VADVRERGTSFQSNSCVKGNAVDLAIGGTIGAAFGTIASSIVDDVITRLAELIIGGVDFSNLFVVVSNPLRAPVPSLAAA